MKKNGINSILMLLAVVFFASSACNKVEGFGGNSTITGKLKVQNYDEDFSIMLEEHFKPNTYVYIVFGNDISYGTRIKTSYDGSFQFNNLTAGNYTVFAYSADSLTNSSTPVAVSKDVSIGKKEIFDVGTIVIADKKPNTIGSIYGKVLMTEVKNGKSYYQAEQKVYITYGDDVNYKKYVRTNYNGEYKFTDLPQGKYTIYCFTKDVNNTSPNPTIPVIEQVEVSPTSPNLTLPDLKIYK